IAYNRVLQQRNALLKQMAERRQMDMEMLDVLDAQLIACGMPVFRARESFIQEFTEVFNRYYALVSGEEEDVSLAYVSQLSGETFEETLLRYRDKDRRFQYSTAGIHKDDLEFRLRTFP